MFTGLGDVGDSTLIAGKAVGPSALRGIKWVVPLIQREGMGATLAHEMAHVMAGDEAPSGEAEFRAVTKANEWGFAGGDPAEARAQFERGQRRVLTRAEVNGDELSL